MQKFRNSIILVFLLGVVTLLIFINQKETETPDGKRVLHFKEAEVIDPPQGPKFDTDWFDSKYQVITYFTYFGEFSAINFDWNSYFDSNPDIKFIFYYSGKKKEELVKWIEENDFRRPVLYDPDKVFYTNNVTSRVSSIVLNTNNGIVKSVANPSFPNYQDSLDELVGRRKD